MFIVLNSNDCKKIAEVIAEHEEEEEVSVTIGGVHFDIEYHLDVEGHCEDDYLTGTGAWVTTSVDFTLYDVKVEDGEDIAIDYDGDLIESEVRDWFND